MSSTKSKVVFGKISYAGDTWMVEFEPEKDGARQELRGYGGFPFEQYDVPVIDLSQHPLNVVVEFLNREFAAIDNKEPAHKYSIRIAREMNLTILNDEG